MHQKTISADFRQTLKDATGTIDYSYLNDYMFRAVLQTDPTALKGLVSAVLHLPMEQISSLEIMNPIELGKSIDNKTFILDIRVNLNNNANINLEMQVSDLDNWTERSLSYLCRTYDELQRGVNYLFAKPAIHIGFLDYDLFPDQPEFFATYRLLNEKNRNLYTDKFALCVLSLNQIHLATEDDCLWKIDQWARLFKATTWEDIKMIAENDTSLQSASATLYKLNADELIREQCRAREDYYQLMNTHKYKMQMLEAELAEKDASLAEQAALIQALEEKLKKYES
ncbi:MAG: Rpn family recombination-promoting nuclease/putative transposase [Lachnospiraceae bacterium]|nr:Rpn family recombination-promoting nuclease/putative transposase [Lachnospiraceae bacterium]